MCVCVCVHVRERERECVCVRETERGGGRMEGTRASREAHSDWYSLQTKDRHGEFSEKKRKCSVRFHSQMGRSLTVWPGARNRETDEPLE